MGINVDLTVVWAFIIAFAVFMYVVMDGFDLGIGILFPSFKVGDERDQAMKSRQCGTATRHGWCWAAAGSLLPSRSPMVSS